MNYNISSGETSSGIILKNKDVMTVFDSGKANVTTVSSGGKLHVSSGGMVSGTTVSTGGNLFVSFGGTADNTSVYTNAYMQVHSGGIANSTRIFNAGQIIVSSGGTATNISVDPEAYYYSLILTVAPDTYITGTAEGLAFEFKDGKISNYTIGNLGAIDISSGGTANRITVNVNGQIRISSGGIANSAIANYGGFVFISSGGTADKTNVKSGGRIEVSSGGIANSTTINSYGRLIVSSGGTANSTSINATGNLTIYSGGTAANIDAAVGAQFDFCVAKDTYVQGTSGGIAFEMKDASISNYVVNGGGWLTVSSGGKADFTTVNSGGSFMVSSCGMAENTVLNGGREWNDRGRLIVRDATVNNTIVNQGGDFTLSFRGTAINTTINSGGIVNISSGGVASNIQIKSGGNLTIEHAKLTGKISIANGGVIHAGQGTVIDFDISRLAPNMGALLNNLSLIQDDSPTFMLTLSEDLQWNGVYALAKGVADFDNVFFIQSQSNETPYMIEIDETVNVDGVDYTLTLTDDTLSVTVAGGRDIPFIPVSEDIGDLANHIMTVTAEFSDEAIVREYSFDNETWHVYTGPVNCYVNDTVYFLGRDGNGVACEIGECEVIALEPIIFSGVVLTNESRSVMSKEHYLDTTVNSGGKLAINPGGMGDNTTVNSNGQVTVFKSATVENTMLVGGSLFISNGGTANNTTVNSGGSLFVSSGGTANNTTVNSRGYASGITLENGNTLIVSSGGTANKTTINNGGVFIVEKGGIVGTTIVKDGGYVTGIVIDPDRGFTVSSGGTANNTTVYSYGNLSVLNKGVATNTRIESWGSLYISSGGTAYDTTVNIGQMFVSSGGYASTVLLLGENHRQEGDIYISGGGVVEDVTIGDYGDYYISSGGTAIRTTVNSTGNMEVSAGGTATEIIENGGYVRLEAGAQASFVAHSFSGLVLSGWSSVDYGYIRNSASVHSGTTAFETEINSAGELTVFSGGTANNTIVNSGGILTISSGGTATVDFNPWKGRIDSRTGAEVTYLERDANIYFGSDGRLVDKANAMDFLTIVSGYSTIVYSGATENDTTINYMGKLYVSGGLVKRTTVNTGGSFQVFSGGIANETTVYGNGSLTVFSGGIADSVKTYAGGKFSISSGGTITGKMSFLAGAIFSVEDGAVIDFDLTRTTAGAKALLSDWSLVQGLPDYTLTVDGNQESGIYKLAGAADEFDGTITVQNTLGESLGTLAVGEKLTIDEVDYTLSIADDCLTVTVDNAAIIPPDADTEAPSAPAGLMSIVNDRNVALLWNESTDDTGVKEYIVTYSLDGEIFTARTTIPHYVLKGADYGTWSWSVQAVDFAGNESAVTAGDAFKVSEFKPYTVEYSADNFEHTIRLTVPSPALDSFRMPGGTYRMRVMAADTGEWLEGDPIEAETFDDAPQLVKSDADGNADVFFAHAAGTWESGYLAQHVGSLNDWAGTDEYAALFGKNKLADIFEGSDDANVLLLTDDANGDALFVDDIYTASPENIAETQARIAQIDEIRAGSGNDIVDMTSQRCEYTGDGLTIRGGDGDDVIWANKGNNMLFGDAGDDRLVGASGIDVIAGGVGNDSMHGGGGNDVFAFCDNWGADTVEQLETGTVTLWFASGDESNWNAETLTYTDGENSVTVSGITAEQITLRFGDDGSDEFAELTAAGAFFDATTERIFEESGKGMLASI